jgi:hypothetical protein
MRTRQVIHFVGCALITGCTLAVALIGISRCIRHEVKPVSGRYAARIGRVSAIEADGESVHVYFGAAASITMGEAGGVSFLCRGNYHLLIDRRTSPWVVGSFHNSVG